MDILTFFSTLLRRWPILLVCMLLGLVGAYLTKPAPLKTQFSTPYYLAKHTLTSAGTSSELDKAAALTVDGEVPNRVAGRLGYPSGAELARQIKAEARQSVDLLEIAAVDTDPDVAVRLANTFAEELITYLRDLENQQQQLGIDELQRQIDELNIKFTELYEESLRTTDTGQLELLRSKRDGILLRINNLEGQKQEAFIRIVPNRVLITLSSAQPVQITERGVARLFDDSVKASNNVSTASAASRIDAAIAPEKTIKLPIRMTIGALFGLFLGIVLVLILDRFDFRIHTKHEAEEAFGWPVIAQIPYLAKEQQNASTLLVHDFPLSQESEAYRSLRSALFFALSQKILPDRTSKENGQTSKPNDDSTHIELENSEIQMNATPVILLTSPHASEGKTTTIANIAASWAEAGRSVLLVNADFRRPRVHEFFTNTAQTGTTAQEDTVQHAPEYSLQDPYPTQISGVTLLDHKHDHEAGMVNPTDILSELQQAIAENRSNYDVILIDTAPLLLTNDAADLMDLADLVLLVARVGKTTREWAIRCGEMLERRNAPVLGVVLVGTKVQKSDGYYYYSDTKKKKSKLQKLK